VTRHASGRCRRHLLLAAGSSLASLDIPRGYRTVCVILLRGLPLVGDFSLYPENISTPGSPTPSAPATLSRFLFRQIQQSPLAHPHWLAGPVIVAGGT
jgi:hypothetical protein